MPKEDTYHLGVKALIKDREKGKILLLKVDTSGFKEVKEPYWDLPGGRVQRGDSVEDTLKREIEEETGITEIQALHHFLTVLSNIRIPLQPEDVGLILTVYVCTVNPDQSIHLSIENTEYEWFSPQDAARLLVFKYPQDFTEKIAQLEIPE